MRPGRGMTAVAPKGVSGRHGFTVDHYAGDRSANMKDQMTFAMGMRHHRPI